MLARQINDGKLMMRGIDHGYASVRRSWGMVLVDEY